MRWRPWHIKNPTEKEKESMNEEYYGRMNDSSGAAVVTGPYGDTMEFYLVIENEIMWSYSRLWIY